MKRARHDNTIQVLSKAAAVLDHLVEREELTVAQLAELVGEPRSTLYRLLSNLQHLELVEPGTRRGTYRLGLKLFRLGSAVLGRFDVRRAALPVMERLHAETDETVFLLIRRGYEAVCVERIEGTWVQMMAAQIGSSLPLHIGAAPRALLAFESRSFWREYVRSRKLERFTKHSLSARGALMENLEAVRASGFAVSNQDVVLGMAAVGAPVFDHDGRLCAAVSISGPVATILDERRERSCALVAAAARKISQALGIDPGALEACRARA